MQIIGKLEDKQISFCLNIRLGSGVIRVFCISVCIHSGRGRTSALILEQEAVRTQGFLGWVFHPRGTEGALL